MNSQKTLIFSTRIVIDYAINPISLYVCAQLESFYYAILFILTRIYMGAAGQGLKYKLYSNGNSRKTEWVC